MDTEDIEKEIHLGIERIRDDAAVAPEHLREWWISYLNSHLAHYKSVIARLPPPDACGPLLEIGSFPGHLTVLLKRLAYNPIAVDLDPTRLSEFWRRYSIKIHKVDIEQQPLPFEDDTFSCVLFTEVLEHLRIHPVFALRETARVLKKGGRLILSVPNITPNDRWKFLWGRDYQGDIIAEFQKLERFGHMGHFRLYSVNEVNRILEHVGYSNIEHRREGRVQGLWPRCVLFPWRQAFRSHVYFVGTRDDMEPRKCQSH